MKTTFLSVSLALVVSAFAQDKLPNIRLDVKNVGSAKQGYTSSYSYYGGYWRDYMRTTQIEAEVGTFSQQPLNLKLEWFFVGKQLAGGQRIIVSRGDQEITVKSGPVVRVRLASEAVRGVESRSHYYYYNDRYVSGAKPDGWVVRVVSKDGKTLVHRASSAQLTEFFRDPAQFDVLIKAAEKEARPAPPPGPVAIPNPPLVR
jgi:hypothetical protein